MLQPGSRRHTLHSCSFNQWNSYFGCASGVDSVRVLFIAIVDSACVFKKRILLFSLGLCHFSCFFVAVSDHGIEYSWVILHCLVHSHAYKQVSTLSVHKTLGV